MRVALQFLFELGAIPIEHKAYSLAIKYWLRLTRGSKNILLNETYKENIKLKSEWLQSIEAMLCINGFRNIWAEPSQANHETFHRDFKKRLDDQYIQNIREKINNSSRFDVLKLVSNRDGRFARQSYLDKIENPQIREYFTRLRIDVNQLESSASKKSKSETNCVCKICPAGVRETVNHFILVCNKFSKERSEFLC